MNISIVHGQVSDLFDTTVIKPRIRVIIDNDFGGDPDGLFHMVHQLLSPSTEVRGIIGSHLNAKDGFDRSGHQAENAAKKAIELLKLMKLDGKVPVFAGSNYAMINDSTPVKSDAVSFIINEALRTDTKLPLYVLCGAGLTEIASAILTKPEIANKITLIWIGGPEYLDLANPPPNYSAVEYNLNIDINAAKAIFNRSSINLWQVPRNAYRQVMLPYSEILTKVKPKGAIGEYLANNIIRVMKLLNKYNMNLGEVYIIGDSPLVLLTALQSSFEPDPSSSKYVIKPAPRINDAGVYEFNEKGRNIRVYYDLDVNLLLDDFFTKLEIMMK
ncbi:MAG: nucleoside hydrolase [Flavisolibacter sp.]